MTNARRTSDAASPSAVAAAGQTSRPSPPLAPTRVLVVDDEPMLRRSLARVLQHRGFDVLTSEDGPSAFALLATTRVDVMLVDLMMPIMSGMQVLERVKREYPSVEVIMLAAFGDVDTAVSAVRAGAYSFLTKPLLADEAAAIALEQAAEHKRLVDRTHFLEERLGQQQNFGELIGSSSRMQDVYRVAIGVAPTTSTVLLSGESGTGKELVARA